MHPDAYNTVEARSAGEFRDRGSKFLAYLLPCISEEDIKQQVLMLRKEHPGAAHVCYAAMTDSLSPEERFNDDGEPSGSAGQPILNRLRSAGLKNAALFVVRYFGGSKLGKAGLIRAYKESAGSAIEAAEIVIRYRSGILAFRFEYDATGEVMQAVDRIPHSRIIAQEFDQGCTLTVEVPLSEIDNALHLFDHTDDVDVETLAP